MKVLRNLFILKWSYFHAKEVSVEYDTQLQIFNKLKEKTDLQLRTKEKSQKGIKTFQFVTKEELHS